MSAPRRHRAAFRLLCISTIFLLLILTGLVALRAANPRIIARIDYTFRVPELQDGRVYIGTTRTDSLTISLTERAPSFSVPVQEPLQYSDVVDQISPGAELLEQPVWCHRRKGWSLGWADPLESDAVEFLVRRGDGLLDSFLLIIHRDSRTNSLYAFPVRMRRGGLCRIQAREDQDPDYYDETSIADYLQGIRRLRMTYDLDLHLLDGSPWLLRYEPTGWWLDQFPPDARGLDIESADPGPLRVKSQNPEGH